MTNSLGNSLHKVPLLLQRFLQVRLGSFWKGLRTDVRSVTASVQTWFFPKPLFEGFILANEASQVIISDSDHEGRETKSSLSNIVLPHDEDALGGLGVEGQSPIVAGKSAQSDQIFRRRHLRTKAAPLAGIRP
jgi:hypothetical protein